jgi:murein DD-endopeptidase MepM/ murein hydrolase activator NlpD
VCCVRQSANVRRTEPGRGPSGRSPHFFIRPVLFYGMFTVLLAGNVLLGTTLLLTPDISRLLNRHTDQVISAYEERITQLRVEVDRLHSRNYAQAGDINLQLQDLAQQQEVLIEQHQLVKVLVDKADELGIYSSELAAQTSIAPLANTPMINGNPDIGATASAVAQMMDETQSAMSSIAQTAASRTDTIVLELSGLGIPVTLPQELSGVGGPLLPARSDAQQSTTMDDANDVLAALARYKLARDSIDHAPIHMPIAGNFRNSSGFGNRRDPFSGGRAFHSGLDFAAPSGTVVFSAGKGVVSFVGTKPGYGNTVEVTHANGLFTRYAHLSGYLSNVGQRVNTGTPIAKVGSTGRSTGPHLHFEIHKASGATNPKAYLDAGKRLLALLN